MNSKIIIRNVHPGDDKAVWKVAKTLGILEWVYFYGMTYKPHKTDALVAVYEKRIWAALSQGFLLWLVKR